MNQQMFHLIWYSAWADLKAQVARLYLGVAWWVIEPLLYMAVFYLVFGILLERGGPGYPVFLLTGLVAFRWFDTSVRKSMNSIIANSNIIEQIYIPKYAFPLISTTSTTLNFLLVFVLLLVFLATQGHYPNLAWFALPYLLGVQFLFAVFIGIATALITPFLPDLRILINNGLMLLLFLSGIFFSIDKLPDLWRSILFLNPVAVLIQAYRDILIDARWPDWMALTIVLAVSIAGLVAVMRFHAKVDLLYAKRLL